MPASQLFTHVSAAGLLGLRLPERIRLDTLDVGVRTPHRAPRLRGIRGHELARDAGRIILPNGLAASPPLEVWCQLGAVLPVDGLIVLGDGLVCRHNPLATLAELGAAIELWGHRPGVRALRLAAPDIRARTDSGRETLLRLAIVRAGLPEPQINPRILNRYGAFVAFGDLAYPEFKVLIEYDGGQHRLSDHKFTRDIARLDELMEEGWRVIRVDKSLIATRATLLGKIRDALTARGWTAPSLTAPPQRAVTDG